MAITPDPSSSVAVIPARGGSKRIPRKNLVPFRGRPIIAWSIAAARASGLFGRVVVSTDDAEIAEVAQASGAEVPFRRPKELSGDHAATVPVIAHALQMLSEVGFDVTTACCIYPAAPFVTPALLRRCHDALLSDAAVQYAFPAIAYGHPVQRGFLLERGVPRLLFPEHAGSRSQDLPEVHHDAGQLYFGRATAFLGGLPILAAHSRAVHISRRLAVDIDSPEDLAIAEALHSIAFPEAPSPAR